MVRGHICGFVGENRFPPRCRQGGAPATLDRDLSETAFTDPWSASHHLCNGSPPYSWRETFYRQHSLPGRALFRGLSPSSLARLPYYFSIRTHPFKHRGGLKNIEDLMEGEETIWVYNGDILSTLPLQRLRTCHERGGGEVTTCLRAQGRTATWGSIGKGGSVIFVLL